MNKTALITGITGQDGSYLAEFLLAKGYTVIGLVRRSATPNYTNIKHIEKELILRQGDVTDKSSIERIFEEFDIDEVYNLCAQSFVPTSWNAPIYTADVNAIGPLNILETIRQYSPTTTKFYQASTSEMFGKVRETPQTETTPFYPRSPYGVAKVYGHYITVNYRESFDLFATSGILFNHESPRRGEEFVTRKISKAVARIYQKKQKDLHLGNLDVKRDWGYAGDYVEAMWMMLQQEKSDTFVIGSGENHSIREFCDIAFRSVNLNYLDYVVVDPLFYRPAEVEVLLSNPVKAKKILGWKQKVSFEDLVKIMVESDLRKEKDND